MGELTGRSESESDNVDRIVLRKIEQQKLNAWLVMLNRKFDGMIRITKSDLANFLIRHHAESLSDKEVALIESEFYDEVRWLNWALTKIRQAKKDGLSLTLDDLMKNRNSKEDGKKPVPNQRRTVVPDRRKNVAPASPSPDTANEAGLSDDTQTDAVMLK